MANSAKTVAKSKKRRGYNKRARSEHPGVTIASEKRASGETVVVLRWKQPGTNKRCKETIKDRSGLPVSARDGAKTAAIKKATEILAECSRIEAGKTPTDTAVTWKTLKEAHGKYLNSKNRTRKTQENYEHVWPYLDRWQERPTSPHKLTLLSLQDYVLFLRRQKNSRTGKKLARATIESNIRHVKAIFNYGRRYLSCVKLDIEALNDGLDAGKKQRIEPAAYSSTNLNAILKAAVELDEKKPPERHVFPLLATFMLTGCRRGELEKLRWFQSSPSAPESYVDFEGERLVVWSTKTDSHRHVPLKNRPLLRQLLLLLEESIDVEGEPFVFGGIKSLAISSRREDSSGHDSVRGRSLKSPLRSVQKASMVQYNLKGIRSTVATFFANSQLGTNLYQVAFELGHRYEVLIKHYAKHRELPDKQADAKTVGDLLAISRSVKNWLKDRQQKTGNVIPIRRRSHG